MPRLLVALGLLLTVGGPGRADEPPHRPPPPARALPPETATLLQAAFGRAQPELRLSEANIEMDHVQAVVCAGETCFKVRLDDPEAGCSDGVKTGPWCLRFPDHDAPAGAAALLDKAFSVDAGASLWIRTQPAAPSTTPAATNNARRSPTSEPASAADVSVTRVHAIGLAIALTIVPFLVGAVAGLGIRKTRGRLRSAWAIAATAAIPVGVIVLGCDRLLVGAWDALWIGEAAVLGLLIASHELLVVRDRRRPLAAAIAILLAFAVGEAGTRAILRAPPGIRDEELLRVLLPSKTLERGDHRFDKWRADVRLDEVYQALYPELSPASFQQRTQGLEAAARHVLHVGDSMVFGLGLPTTNAELPSPQAFPALLAALQPGVAHVNAGVPGTSPDFYYLVARDWSARIRADLVVVHVFLGNDLLEMDDVYPFCAGGPLLDYSISSTGMHASARCPSPRPGPTRVGRLGWYLAHSPPPLALRVMVPASRLAHTFTVGLWALRGRLWGAASDEEVSWSHIEAALRSLAEELAARHVPLVVDVLPVRRALEEPHPEESYAYAQRSRLLDLCRRLGVPALDPWPLFIERVQRDGSDRWFTNTYAGDVHLSAEGHAVLARWLAEQLPASK